MIKEGTPLRFPRIEQAMEPTWPISANSPRGLTDMRLRHGSAVESLGSAYIVRAPGW